MLNNNNNNNNDNINFPLSSSLQCRRFWWSIECFAAILDSLQTGRIGARMTECRRGGRRGRENKTFPLPLPQFFFLSPTLGKLFTSPQLSTVFLFQDGGLNIRWKYISTRPAKIRLHGRLIVFWLPNTIVSAKESVNKGTTLQSNFV